MLVTISIVSISRFILGIVIPSRHAVKHEGAYSCASQLWGLGRHECRCASMGWNNSNHLTGCLYFVTYENDNFVLKENMSQPYIKNNMLTFY